MKLIRFIFLFFLLLNVSWLAGCAATTDPTAAFKNQTSAQIYQGGEQALAKKKYSTAVKHYEALDALYPFSADAGQADLDIIYAYYMNDDAPSAEAAADRYTRLYPRSPNVDYAYYMKGLADFTQDRGWIQRFFPLDLTERDPGSVQQTFTDFGALTRQFPDSPYAPDARQRMIYLRNLLAAYELNVAKYYFRRGAYVAAANRANYIIQHYDGTPQDQQALGIMIKSYRALGLDALVNQTVAVLKWNYPNGPVLQELIKEKYIQD